MRQFTYNDANIPIADSNQIATAKTQQGVTSGCAAFLTCAAGGISCGAPLVCVDFWKGAFCTCPANLGPTFKEDGTLSGCGASVAALHLGITRGAIAAILISLLALICKLFYKRFSCCRINFISFKCVYKFSVGAVVGGLLKKKKQARR